MPRQGFERRKKELYEYISLVDFIDKTAQYRYGRVAIDGDNGGWFSVTQDERKVSRAGVILLLYNLVESTVNACIMQINDTITDEKLRYCDLTPTYRKLYINQELGEKTTSREIQSTVNKLMDKSSTRMLVFQKIAVNISGNLDYRKICDLMKSYSCPLQEEDEETKNALLKVKNIRNSLAHGNKSFGEIGVDFLIPDLRQLALLIVGFLENVIANVEVFLANKGYKLRE